MLTSMDIKKVDDCIADSDLKGSQGRGGAALGGLKDKVLGIGVGMYSIERVTEVKVDALMSKEGKKKKKKAENVHVSNPNLEPPGRVCESLAGWMDEKVLLACSKTWSSFCNNDCRHISRTQLIVKRGTWSFSWITRLLFAADRVCGERGVTSDAMRFGFENRKCTQ